MRSSPLPSVQQARQALADRLKELRLDAGLTARDLARRAGWHESKTSRIEHARTAPADADIRAWCAACGTEDQVPDLIASLRAVENMYVEWRRLERAGLRRLQESAYPLYESTSLFRIYEPGVIPGLLQTREYATARMRAISAFHDLPDDIDDAVDARMGRQRVLHSGARFAMVVEEWALSCRIGEASMMAAQLEHLKASLRLPSLSFGIIPAGISRSMWSNPGMWIFDDVRVHVETPAARLTITIPREVRIYIRTFGELASMAVYGDQARALISSAIEAL